MIYLCLYTLINLSLDTRMNGAVGVSADVFVLGHNQVNVRKELSRQQSDVKRVLFGHCNNHV